MKTFIYFLLAIGLVSCGEKPKTDQVKQLLLSDIEYTNQSVIDLDPVSAKDASVAQIRNIFLKHIKITSK
jgi:hypothetical protein